MDEDEWRRWCCGGLIWVVTVNLARIVYRAILVQEGIIAVSLAMTVLGSFAFAVLDRPECANLGCPMVCI